MQESILCPSRFNIIKEGEKGSLLIYNSLKKSIFKIPSDRYQEAKELLQKQKIEKTDSVLIEQLYQHGLLVEEEYKEEAAAHAEYIKEIGSSVLGLTIVPTFRCNFRCPYCYQDHEQGEMMGEEIQNAIRKYVLKNISRYTEVEIEWFGGEPLLCKEVILNINNEIKTICNKRYKTFKSGITTNGYLLTKNTFEKLHQSGIYRYFITIDGIEAMHNKQRYLKNGKATYDVIIQNLLDIKSLAKTKHFTINIRTNVSKESMEHIDTYLKYMYERFADDERFTFFFRPVFDWGGESIEDFRSNLLDEYKGLRDIFNRLIESPYKMNYLEHYLDLTQSAVCYASKLNHYIINPNGDINKCTCSETGGNNLVGKLLPSGIMKLDMDKIGMWTSQYEDTTLCKDCKLLGICHKSYCVSNQVMHGEKRNKCFISQYTYSEILTLLDKCNDTYQYIQTIK